MGRLARQRRAAQRGRAAAGPLAQLVVPLAAVDALELALQALVAVLLGPDLLGNLVAVRGIQLGDELGDQVLVLQRLLDGGQAGALALPLGGVGAVGGEAIGVGGLVAVELPAQALEVKVAQGIGAQAAGLEVLVRGDVGVVVEQVRDAGKDGGADAVGMEALEQQERLEVGVGRDASRHPPGVCSGASRAVGGWRDGSQGGGGGRAEQRRRRQRLLETDDDGHRMRRAMGRWAGGDGGVERWGGLGVGGGANCRRKIVVGVPLPAPATPSNARPPIRRVRPHRPRTRLESRPWPPRARARERERGREKESARR